VAPVAACDLPQFLSKAQLRKEIDRRIDAGAGMVRARYVPASDGPMSEVTRDLSSTTFIPPISMTLSLLSVALNVASLAGILAVFAAYAIANWRVQWLLASTARWVQGGVTVIALVGILAAMDGGSPFATGGRFAAGEQQARSGSLAAQVWAFGLDRESSLLEVVDRLPGLTALADALPAVGQRATLEYWTRGKEAVDKIDPIRGPAAQRVALR